MNYRDILLYQAEVKKFASKYNILPIIPTKLVDKVSDKIPVWVYWHQGFDNAPDIVHMCINSLKENMPLDKVEIILLDKNNLFDYVYTDPKILHNIKTNYTAYSNIVRSYLLYAYGGMYIDATYLLVDKFPAENFNRDFWAVKTIYPTSEAGFPLIMFTSNLMYAKPGNEIMLFIFQYMSSYWYYYDYNILYDFIMGICLYGYQYKKYPQYYVNSLDDTNFRVHYFCQIESQNEIYSEERYNELAKDNIFFKVNRKCHPQEYIKDQLTFWGYFKQRYLKEK